MARSVTIQFLGNERDLVRATNAAGKSTSRLGSTLRRIGRSAVIGFGAAAIIAGKGLWEMGQMAAEDEASAAKLALALKNATGATDEHIAAVEDQIKATSLATGVTDDELRPALAKLAVVTGDVEKAQRLLSIGMDVAAGTGKSLESVTAALQKAQNGSVGGLARLGVATKNAAGETLSFDQIQKNLAKTFEGQSAKAAETTSGKFARLKVALQEAGEEIGAKLIPYAIRLSDWMLETGIPAAQRLGSWFKEHISPALADVANWFQQLTTKGDGTGETMNNLRETGGKLARIFEGLWPLMKQIGAVAFPMIIASINRTIKVIGWLGDAFIFLWNNYWAPVLKKMTHGLAGLLLDTSQMLGVLASVPGAPKWMTEVAEKAFDAGKAMWKLSDSIRKIPDGNATVTVTTVYKTKGTPSGGDEYGTYGGRSGKGVGKLATGAPASASRGAAGSMGGGVRGGAIPPTIVQLVMPGGKVIEQILIRYSRETGRPIQVQTI